MLNILNLLLFKYSRKFNRRPNAPLLVSLNVKSLDFDRILRANPILRRIISEQCNIYAVSYICNTAEMIDNILHKMRMSTPDYQFKVLLK